MSSDSKNSSCNISSGESMSDQYLREQIKLRDREIEELREANEELKREMRECKEFFGYEPGMDVGEMSDYKEECEEEDWKNRRDDQELDKRCERSEQLVDLVVLLGEQQYSSSQIMSRLNKMAGTNVSSQRKSFVSAFSALRNQIPEHLCSDFFDHIKEWIKIQYRIWDIDRRIKNIDSV